MTAVKPPFAYYGGKTSTAEYIASLLPEHDHYIEPFAGSLAVLLAKKPSAQETVNDIDSKLILFWRVLRDRPEELLRACALTPHSREELEHAHAVSDDELEAARRVWATLTQSRSHTVKATGWWRRVIFAGMSPGDYSLAYVHRMAAVAERMRGVSIENRDAIEIIRDYGTWEKNLLYLDPPYLGSTRASNYRKEMLGDNEHEQFANIVNQCKAQVVISGYDSELYKQLFEGWHTIRFRGGTTLSGDNSKTEVLWSNRPLTRQPELDLGGIA